MVEEKKPEVKILTAKRHSTLADISKQLSGGQITDSFNVINSKFTMSTLSAIEDAWADGMLQINNEKVLMTTYFLSRIAASIKAINDIPVADLFEYPDGMDENVKDAYNLTHASKRVWEMDQMLVWLGEQPPQLTIELSSCFKSLEERRKVSWSELKNS